MSFDSLNGGELTCNEWSITDGALATTDVITNVEVEGSRKKLGETPNIIGSVVIENKTLSGSERDVTDCYSITIVEGKLIVTE